MPIDPSIYANVKTPQVNMPSPLDTAQSAMSLADLSMRSQAMNYQLQQQMALRHAYARNTNPDGSLNRQGFLSSLGQVAPQAVPGALKDFAATDKAQAEAQSAQMESQQKVDDLITPRLQYLKDHVKPEDQPVVYHNIMKDFAARGVPVSNVPPEFDQNWLDQTLGTLANRAKFYEAQKSQSDIENTRSSTAKNVAETGAIPSKIAEQQANTRKAEADTAKTQSETFPRDPSMLGATDDPAAQVARRVPKDHQAKALEEIKNAEDIKALAPKIMAAFQRGSSRNPVTAAQGQREFEGLINTTVKDTEGTARQAAFDSIHRTMTPSGPTALPGENDAKARTVQEYLTAKASAPTARSYGVDLTRFDSTSPYQGKDRLAQTDQVKSSTSSRKVAIKPGAVEDGYVYMGGDPGKPTSWKKAL